MTQQSESQSENTVMYITEAFLLFQTSLLPNNETQFDVTIEGNEIETADAEHKNHETQFAVITDADPINNEMPNYICDYVPKTNRELYAMTIKVARSFELCQILFDPAFCIFLYTIEISLLNISSNLDFLVPRDKLTKFCLFCQSCCIKMPNLSRGTKKPKLDEIFKNEFS
jgi:hypothetical protein